MDFRGHKPTERLLAAATLGVGGERHRSCGASGRNPTPRSPLVAGEAPLAPKRKVSPMSKKNPRTADFHIRMTPEERANIDEVAEKCGLTRSQLIRLLAQLPTGEIHGSNVHLVFVDRKEMMRIHREMRRFGTNFNQATHSLNSISYYLRNGKLRYEYLDAALPEIREKLDAVNLQQKELCEEMSRLETAMFAS